MVFYSSLWDNQSGCQQGSAGYSITKNHKTERNLKSCPTEKLNNWQREDGYSKCAEFKQAEKKNNVGLHRS